MNQNAKESVWAISKANIPFLRAGISPGKEEGTKWLQVDGMVDQLNVSKSGTVWAVMHDKLVYRAGVTPNKEEGTGWTTLSHSFSAAQVAAGGGCLWVCDAEGKLNVRTGMGKSSRLGSGWTDVPTPNAPTGISDIAITAADDVFVLTDDGKLFKRDGLTDSCPEGVAWTKVTLPKTGGSGFLGLGAAPAVIHIAGGYQHIWAVTESQEVWRCPYKGIIQERSWDRIPGQKMAFVSPSMCDSEITWGINNKDQVFVRTSPHTGRYEWLRQGTIMFRMISVGVVMDYSAQERPGLSRTLSQNWESAQQQQYAQYQRTELKVTDIPFKVEQCDEMDPDLLAALVTPVLTKNEVLQRFNYDFCTENSVLNTTS